MTELALPLLAAFASVSLAAVALAGALRTHAARWQARFGTDLGEALRQSFLYPDVARLFRLNLLGLAVLAAAAGWLTGEPLAVLLAMVLAGAVPVAVLAWLRRRRVERLAVQLPDAAMLIAGALRAGSSVAQSIAQAARESPAPLGREFDLVVREQRLGVGLDASMQSLERRVPLASLTLFTAAIRIAQDTGGNLAETLERLADTLRRTAAIEGKIDALTTQGRLQGWVMALLPIGVAVALFVIDPQSMQPLFGTWQGAVVCAAIVVLEGLGLHFIRRIVDIDV